MTALTLIAEPFPDWEAAQHLAAARDLTIGVAETAPRACSARYLAARGEHAPEFASARIRSEHLPIPTRSLPFLWRSGAAARPLDGEFTHAVTPFMPLRAREENDGTQTTVMVPHDIAWHAPELLGAASARSFRSFVHRAAKYADVLLTPSHAVADALQKQYGNGIAVQVLPLAPPQEFLEPSDRADRAEALELPEAYLVTTANPGEHGRLEWVFNALRADNSLPPVVIIEGLDPVAPTSKSRATEPNPDAMPEDLVDRVFFVQPRELSDVGAILAGASLLLQPQSFSTTGYSLLGALDSGVPVLHAGRPATTEAVLDAGVIAETEEAFKSELSNLFASDSALTDLSVLARDRSRAFSWNNTAWQLWETHANL